MSICYLCTKKQIICVDVSILATNTLVITAKLCLQCLKIKLENNEEETETIKEVIG